MLKPVNKHLLIEPVPHDSFVASFKDTYQEIGTVVAMSDDLKDVPCAVGQRVYFDSWLAVRYPMEGGSSEEFYWLIQWADVRATEDAQPA